AVPVAEEAARHARHGRRRARVRCVGEGRDPRDHRAHRRRRRRWTRDRVRRVDHRGHDDRRASHRVQHVDRGGGAGPPGRGARAGMVAPDATTYAYLEGRPYAPKGARWEEALGHWRTLPSDEGAAFDGEVRLDAADIAPMVTWGTSPQEALPITGRVPDPEA